jgi:hypothetical protein
MNDEAQQKLDQIEALLEKRDAITQQIYAILEPPSEEEDDEEEDDELAPPAPARKVAASSGSVRLCSRCRKPGHIARKCPDSSAARPVIDLEQQEEEDDEGNAEPYRPTETEQQVLDLYNGGASYDEIFEETNLPVSRIKLILSTLRVKGLPIGQKI